MRVRIVSVFALAALTCGVMASPAAAGGPDPCKVFKKSEIASVFAGTVGAAKKGLTTAVSATCDFEVTASSDVPDGTFTVHIMFTGAKAGYDGLKKIATYEPVPELGKALYSAKTSVVDVLKGDILIGVQGVFIDSAKLPLAITDVKTQLVALAKKGVKRV
jgi:hypothetical protein